MKEKTTSVRNFLRNYKQFIEENKTILVQNHGTPQFVIVPYKQWTKEKEDKKPAKMSIKKALEGLDFEGGDADLSKNVDKILYSDFSS